jgi:cytochrome c-type biogenesis protein CcsB
MKLPTITLALLATLLACVSAFAQPPAPAGNAHPQTEAVSEENKSLASPFGKVAAPAPGEQWQFTDPIQKHQFAKQLNLEPLRGLAVFHNGRVKVMETLAKETIERISGRKKFQLPESFKTAEQVHLEQDQSAGKQAQTTPKLAFDPLFTLMDLTIDPIFYLDKPLIGVTYLPLRRELLENQFPLRDNPQNAEKQEAWLRLGRVAPFMVDRWSTIIRQTHMGEQQYMDALNRTDNSLIIFADSAANFEMIAPERSDLPWQHISALADDHPVRKASLELGQAWRAMDVSKTNAAIATLAAELPEINAQVYPTTRRSLELFYNKLNAFEWGWVVYALSLVSLLLAFGTGRRTLAWLGTALLIAGALLHATGFIARGLIAERWAIQNQFESMTGISLFAVLVAIGLMIARRQWLFGAAAAAVGFMVLVTATQTAIPGEFIEREAAILNTSVLLKYHVTIVLVSYGLIALGFITSLFYLGTHYLHKFQSSTGAGASQPPRTVHEQPEESSHSNSRGLGSPRPAPCEESLLPAGPTIYRTLADLDKATMIVLQLAFWTLGVGILLGAWWADHSWGRWWAFDPKETWALITWIVYLIVIHVRRAGLSDKGLTTAWLSVAGFVIMLWTYFGVNLLLPGLHAYA